MSDVGTSAEKTPDTRTCVLPAVNVAERVVNAPGKPASPPRTLQEQLGEIIASSADLHVVAQRMAEVAQTLVRASFLSFVAADVDGPARALAAVGSIDNIPSLSNQNVAKLSLLAMESCSIATRALGDHDKRHVVAVPIHIRSESRAAVVAVLEQDETPLTKRVLILELVSSALERWQAQQTTDLFDWEARTVAAVAELVSQIETSPSQNYACLLAANKLNDYLTTNCVAIALKNKRGVGVRLSAISGKAEFDPQAEFSKQLVAAMDETLVRDNLTIWPPLSAGDRHSIISHRQLAQQQHEEAVVSIPLTTIDGRSVGVWLCCGPREVLHARNSLNGITTIAPHLATALAVRGAADPGPIRAVTQKALGSETPLRRWCVTAAVVLCCLLPLMPIKHRIKSDCVVEPVQHRYVVVPFDGILKETYVRPGDEVRAGQLVARMDDRELGWDLGGLLAEAGRAAKKSDVAMAKHDVHEAQMATLEKERLEQRIQTLRHRQENLDITSSINGFVLKGDLEEAQGAPVKIGQSLFEIAPLSPLKLEVAVPEEDVAYVQPGMPVTARLIGYPQNKIYGHVDTLHPRAEIRDNQNVFVAEVTLDNDERQLRPGMSGRARIIGKRKLLGWIWLHKAWHRVRNAMGA